MYHLAMRCRSGGFAGVVLLVAVFSSCGSSSPAGGPAAGFTAYDSCFPPCVEDAIVGCLGAVSACTSATFTTCWDDGAYATLTINPNSTSDKAYYDSSGALCLTIHQSSDPMNGSAQEFYYDPSGTLLATLLYDPKAVSGYVWQCGGKSYAAQIEAGCKDANGGADLLTGNICPSPATPITSPLPDGAGGARVLHMCPWHVSAIARPPPCQMGSSTQTSSRSARRANGAPKRGKAALTAMMPNGRRMAHGLPRRGSNPADPSDRASR